MFTYREKDTCNVFIFYQNIEISSSKRPIFEITACTQWLATFYTILINLGSMQQK